MAEKKDHENADEIKHHEKKDVIEIPVGKTFNKIRSNPWILASVVLAVIVIVLLIYRSGAGISGDAVSGETAGQNLISFINAQGNGNAEFVSAEKSDGFYQVIVKYQDQDIPVYVTLDGKYLISDKIPLVGAAANVNNDDTTNTNTNTNTGEAVEVKTGDAPTLGSKDAKVTIVEFTDYECPFCGKHYTDSYKQIKRDYVDTGKVKYVTMNFPLSFHPQAQKAAEAALCVKEQKGDTGYYLMHDKLFENQQTLSVENEKKWAKELGADTKKFDDCLDSGKMAAQVQAEESYGQTLGVSGTPSSFINGIQVSGAQPYAAFKQVIDQELSKV